MMPPFVLYIICYLIESCTSQDHSIYSSRSDNAASCYPFSRRSNLSSQLFTTVFRAIQSHNNKNSQSYNSHPIRNSKKLYIHLRFTQTSTKMVQFPSQPTILTPASIRTNQVSDHVHLLSIYFSQFLFFSCFSSPQVTSPNLSKSLVLLLPRTLLFQSNPSHQQQQPIPIPINTI